MGRRSSPAFDLKMYRHFAVVTVALTTVLAVFADGEGQQAQAAESQPQVSAASAPSPVAPTRTERRPSAPGWVDDASEPSGQTFDIAARMGSDWGADGGAFAMPGMNLADVALGEDVFRQLGIAPRAFADLTEAEQCAMLAELHNRQAANAAAASRQRAGGPEDGTDA